MPLEGPGRARTAISTCLRDAEVAQSQDPFLSRCQSFCEGVCPLLQLRLWGAFEGKSLYRRDRPHQALLHSPGE